MTEAEQLEYNIKKAKFVEIYNKTPEERIAMGLDTQKAQLAVIGISAVTYNKWRRELINGVRNPESDVEILDEELRKRALENKNPKYMELYLKRLGMLTEKKEDSKFELSVSDRIRIANEVVNGLREESQRINGSCPLCHQSNVLRNKVRQSPEPELQESGEVVSMAVPS